MSISTLNTVLTFSTLKKAHAISSHFHLPSHLIYPIFPFPIPSPQPHFPPLPVDLVSNISILGNLTYYINT